MNIRFSAVMRGSFVKLRGFPVRFERLIGRDSSFIGLPLAKDFCCHLGSLYGYIIYRRMPAMNNLGKKFSRIGVLTSGGDAPGMNAAVRAVTRHAIGCGVEVYGIYEGYRGLLLGEGYIKQLCPKDVSGIVNKGGTVLYSARCDEFRTDDGIRRAAQTCELFRIDGIVAIGGDGTFKGASELCKRGVPCIGIPATIDNDITCTDYSIGFDTAVNTVIENVDKLRDTCESHARCSVVEVMGRKAGYIALSSAISVGATAVLINEDKCDINRTVIEKIRDEKACGKRNFIVIVSEGIDESSESLAKRIESETGVETKFARLAHIIRGGAPTHRDRLAAAEMGVAAVDLLLQGRENLFICERESKITSTDIMEAITTDRMYKSSFIQAVNFDLSELSDYSDSQIEKMKTFCMMRRSEIRRLLRIAESISNYL